MSESIDLISQKFGRLIVIRLDHKDKREKLYWLCRCSCGQEAVVREDSLKNGDTKSCGCLRKEMSTKHGHNTKIKVSKTYKTWCNIIQRCTNPKSPDYSFYGGRGIRVYRRWLKFENFLKDMGEVPEGHQIDRIDNNGNYCKSNCRWVTSKINNRNRRDNHLETYMGKTQCLSAWAEDFDMNYGTLSSRIFKYGWSIEEALTTPVKKHKRKII